MTDRDEPGPARELLASASQRPPGSPFTAKYQDPITVALLKLPFVSYDRRQALAGKWEDVKPALRVNQSLQWYAHHDRNLLLLARLAVATTPLLLSEYGVPVAWIVSGVVVSMFTIEWLDRVRSERELELAKDEAKKEYWREVERPRLNARERELWPQVAEEQDGEDEEVESTE